MINRQRGSRGPSLLPGCIRSDTLATAVLAAFSTALILLAVFARKGLIPFGENSLVYGDAYSQIVPFLHQLWDTAHGDGSLFVGWNAGLVSNSWGEAAYYLLSPFNLPLLFFPRDALLDGYHLLLILKLSAAAFAMSWFLGRIKALPTSANLMFSLLYGLSIYSLATNAMLLWADAVVVFPPLLGALYDVLETPRTQAKKRRRSPHGSSGPLVFWLTTMLVVSFYLAVLTLLIVLMAAPVYLWLFQSKERRGEAALRLGLATFASVTLSLPVTLPAVLQIVASSRSASPGYLALAGSGFQIGLAWEKGALYLTTALVLGVVLVGRKALRKNRKALFCLGCGLIFLVPVLCEAVNLMLHLGSYNGFGFRYAFIPIALFLTAAALVWPTLETPNPNPLLRRNNTAALLGAAIASAALATTSYNIFENRHRLSGFVFCLAVAVLVLVLASGRWRDAALLMVVTGQLLMLAEGYLINYHPTEFRDDYRKNLLVAQSVPEFDNFSRLLDKEAVYPANGGLVRGIPALSHYSSLLDRSTLDALIALGYAKESNTILDVGGTLFSDSVLAAEFLLYPTEQSTSLLVPLVGGEGGYLHRNTAALPFGLLTDRLPEDGPFVSGQALQNQNALFAALTGDDVPLIDIVPFVKTGEDYAATLSPNKQGLLYLSLGQWAYLSADVYLNGEPVDTRFASLSHAHPDNTRTQNGYPTYTHNGILFLGEFDGPVTVRLHPRNGQPLYDAYLGFLPSSHQTEFSQNAETVDTAAVSGSSMTLTLRTDKPRTLFLPMAYSEGWSAESEGQPLVTRPALGAFLAVEVPTGTRQVTLRFVPPGLMVGCLLALLALAVILLVRRRPCPLPRRMSGVAWWLLAALALAAVVLVFVLPLVLSARALF